MRYGGSKLKKREKCDFCGIFYDLNGVKSKHVVSEICDPKHPYFPFSQNMFGLREPKSLNF